MYTYWTFKQSRCSSAFWIKIQNDSMQNCDAWVLTRARQLQPFIRVKHRILHGVSARLRIIKSVQMCRGHSHRTSLQDHNILERYFYGLKEFWLYKRQRTVYLYAIAQQDEEPVVTRLTAKLTLCSESWKVCSDLVEPYILSMVTNELGLFITPDVLRFCLFWALRISASYLAEMSVKPHQKLFTFIIEKMFPASKHPKNILFNFENRSTAQNTVGPVQRQTSQFGTLPYPVIIQFKYQKMKGCVEIFSAITLDSKTTKK